MKNVVQLSTEEREMMKEVSAVFSKYKSKTRRFGLQLIHTHFPINKDEILFETHDKKTRILITKPVKKAKAKDALATAWEIKENGKIKIAMFCCEEGGNDEGTITHPPKTTKK